MSLAASVGRNTIIQFIGKVFGTLLGVITAAVIQRYLRPEGFGAYTAAMAYVSFFSVVADLGLYLILIRDINKPNADVSKIISTMLGLRWASALLILGGSAIVVWALPFYSVAVKQAIQIGAISFVAVAGTQLLVALFQSRMSMVWVTVAELIGRVALLGGTVLVVLGHLGLQSLMLVVAGSSALNLIMLLSSTRKFATIRPRIDWVAWKAILRDALPVSISIVLNLIYFKADTILLSVFHKGDYAIGLYGAAYKVLEILITFPIIFVGLLLPTLGRAHASNDRETFLRVFQKGFEILLLLVTPLIIGGSMLAREILVAIGKGDFAPAAPVLQMLLIAVGASYLNALSGHTITIINRQRQMVWGYLSVALIGLITYVTLIPRFSYYGAATGTILTESLAAIIGYALILRVMRFRMQLGVIPKLVLAGALMAASIALLRPFEPWFALVVGGLVYSVVVFSTRALPLSIIRQMLGRSETVDVLPPTP